MQLICGGLMLLIVALGTRHARWTFNAPGLIALAYLTLMIPAWGSPIRVADAPCDAAVIGSYSYVNPAIAALVGWWFLHERLSHSQRSGWSDHRRGFHTDDSGAASPIQDARRTEDSVGAC